MTQKSVEERVSALEADNGWLQKTCASLEKKMDSLDKKVWGLLVTNISLIVAVTTMVIELFKH